MEEFAQKVLTLTRTRPIIETFFLESHAPDALAVVPFILAAFSGCILLLLQFAPIKCFGGRKADLGEADDRKTELNVLYLLPFRVIRISISFILLALSAYDIVAEQYQSLGVLVCLALFYVYTTVLCFVTLIASTPYWRANSTQHVTTLYFVAFIIYACYFLQPFVLSGQQEILTAAGSSVGWARFWLLMIVGGLIPLFMPRPFLPSPSQETPNPEQTASYFSLATYSYLDRLILQAFRVPHLKLEELPPLQEKHTTSFVSKKAFPLLDPTQVDVKKSHIFWRLSVYLRTAYVQLCLSNGAFILSNFIAPYALKQLLQYLEQPHTRTDETVRPWVWVVLIGLGPILSSIFDQMNYVTSTRITVHMEAILTQLVFEHSMRIRLNAPTSEVKKDKTCKKPEAIQPPPPAGVAPESQTVNEATTQADEEITRDSGDTSPTSGSDSDSKSTASNSTATAVETAQKPKDVSYDGNKPGKSLIGVMTNLVTTDLNILKTPAGHLLEIPFMVLTMILSVVFLYSVLGWSSLLGVLVAIITLPAPTLLSKLMITTQKEKMQRTDDRVQWVTQNINVMRMIKLFAWEPKIEDQIFQRRQKELKLITRGRIFENATQFVQALLPLASMIVTYATFTLVMKQELSASVVYSSMAVFDILRDKLRRTFWFVPIMLRAKVSLDRFNEFFADTKLIGEVNLNDPGGIFETPSGQIKFYPSIYTWTSDEDTTSRDSHGNHRFILQVEEELAFQPGAISLILGPTASGKTSVLMALLGEMYSTSRDSGRTCELPRENGVAYAAQESWVLNDTIRNNILFGEDYDEERYQKTLHQCALEPDIDRFEAGDSTEIGEKGITLSGGQKARVTLARAVYSRAQIILLDDVLSALDVHTAKWVVDKCLRGDLLLGRTVLLVTHNVALAAPVASFCVELSSDGRIIRHGPLEYVISNSTTLQEEADMVLKEMEKVDDHEKENLDDKSSKGKLVVAEEIALGRVAWPAVKLYSSEIGGPTFWTLFLAGIIGCYVLNTMQVWFLGYWASQYDVRESGSVPIAKYLGIYVAIACAAFALQSVSEIWYLFGTIRASRVIHAKLISSVFRATLRWLDTVPLARIISRCTTDIQSIDDNMSNILEALIEITVILLVSLVAVISIAGWTAALLGAVVFLAGAGCGIVYLKAQLCIKRENSNAKSPIISHFHAALSGLVSIRAYGAQAAFQAKARENIDRYNRSAYALYDLNRWIAIRSDVCGGLFSGLVSAYLVYGNNGIIASDIGFALNQILAFSGNLLYFIRIYNTFEVQANSAERIRDFLLIDHEPVPTEEGKPPAYWPGSGHLKAENLSARYSQDGPLVLQNLTFDIRSGERIGIVGRTGAGKSTFSLALLRGIPTSGQVYFDGREISQINLDALRSSMTLIPQQPELLAGSLRENLDPFSQHDDATLYSALRSAGLYNLSSSREASSSDLAASATEQSSNVTLDTYIDAGGSNFSLGQRQIVALARAMVRRSKVLLLDEATASIDHDTDAAIQRAIRTELEKDTTVITVAHRLHTIMDSDRIMVLDAGNLVEFDSPSVLLSKESSYFRKMVDESMDKEKLLELAGL